MEPEFRSYHMEKLRKPFHQWSPVLEVRCLEAVTRKDAENYFVSVHLKKSGSAYQSPGRKSPSNKTGGTY